MSIVVAKKCFTENLQLLSGPGGSPTDPVAWNQNQGLLEMAKELQVMHTLLQRLERDLRQANSELSYLKSHTR